MTLSVNLSGFATAELEQELVDKLRDWAGRTKAAGGTVNGSVVTSQVNLDLAAEPKAEPPEEGEKAETDDTTS